MAYLEGVGITPSQSVEVTAVAGVSALPESVPEAIPEANPEANPDTIHESLLNALFEESGAATYGLARQEFTRILERVATVQNFGLAAGAQPSRQQQESFFRDLKLIDLVLARACAGGHEGAWEHFLAAYRQPLTRAAIAITGSETLGRDLADQLYAELYGLTTRDGARRSPLDSYKGRGSLFGWLRTTLAQRHVDHHRRTHRELPLDDPAGSYEPPAAVPEPVKPAAEMQLLTKAIEEAFARCHAEERFLLAAYYMDGRTLQEIAHVFHVHEATVSRKLRRVTGDLRKQVVKNLQASGLSKRAAQEALGIDPRDLELNLKKMLQTSSPNAFTEKAVS
ncbi:MAG: RNA polymerase sigma factor [Terracidiphilus sp.]